MGAAAAIMGAGTLVNVGAQVYAAEANKKIARYNANVLDAQAVDAIARGEEAVENEQTSARLTAGSQRAALAGQGIDLSSRTAQDIAADTQKRLGTNIDTLRVNAAREAWGFSTQARMTRKAGQYAYTGAMLSTVGSGLTGTAQTVGAARRSA
jgi:hypothetical protein